MTSETLTSQTYSPELLAPHSEPAARVFPRALRPLSPVPTVTGVVIAAVGLVMIIVAWTQVAGEPNVARQVPYLLSGGILGLAVVMIGLIVVNVASKRRETALREQQTQLLADAVEQLGRVLGGDLHEQS